jgi:hypothetical protein
MNEPSSSEKPVRLFFYSTILPAVWIAVSLLGYVLLQGKRLGIVGTVLMLIGVAALISWLFVRRHRRPFSKSEYWRIIIYCAAWTYLLESLALISVAIQDGGVGHPLNPATWALIILISFAIEFLLVWLAFRQTGRKVISRYLASLENKALAEKGVELE